MIINCIVVEDEPIALERTKSYINRVQFLNLVNAFDNAIDALSFMKQHPVDLLFLDIEMDNFTGIDLLEILNNPPKVILTTAFEHYALKGYEFNVADYLLKPFGFHRFLKAVESVYDTFKSNAPISKDYLFVKSGYKIQRIAFNNILYIEGMRDYRNIRTSNEKILTPQTFTMFEQSLPMEQFCRVHKSYIISIPKIEFIEKNRIRILDKIIPISDTYKEKFFSHIDY